MTKATLNPYCRAEVQRKKELTATLVVSHISSKTVSLINMTDNMRNTSSTELEVCT